MIYVYRQSSRSAKGLVDALNEEGAKVKRLKAFADGTPKSGDTVVNWGAYIERWPWGTGVRYLNKHIIGDKLQELRLMQKAGVPVPEFRTDQPPRGRLAHDGRWIARRTEHFEANDVRAGLEIGDYYTRWLDIDKEFRFHVFLGKIIKIQEKEKERADAHDWIRSSASGWEWYNGGKVTPDMRRAATQAVSAVRYDFGAVDVGRLRGGGFVVLEVNAGPGIDPGGATVFAYADAIIEIA